MLDGGEVPVGEDLVAVVGIAPEDDLIAVRGGCPAGPVPGGNLADGQVAGDAVDGGHVSDGHVAGALEELTGDALVRNARPTAICISVYVGGWTKWGRYWASSRIDLSRIRFRLGEGGRCCPPSTDTSSLVVDLGPNGTHANVRSGSDVGSIPDSFTIGTMPPRGRDQGRDHRLRHARRDKRHR